MNYYDPQNPNLYGGQVLGYGAPQTQQMMPYYQPAQTKRDDNHFVWIQGREAAMAYPIVPNTTLIFLDDQQPYVYKKKTDMEGKTLEFKVFKLVEESPNGTTQPEFVTRQDFDMLISEVASLKEELTKRNKPYYKKPRGGKNYESTR